MKYKPNEETMYYCMFKSEAAYAYQDKVLLDVEMTFPEHTQILLDSAMKCILSLKRKHHPTRGIRYGKISVTRKRKLQVQNDINYIAWLHADYLYLHILYEKTREN